MRPSRRYAVLALFLAAGFAASGLCQDLKQLFKQSHPSVFLLRVFDASGTEVGTGTGFLVKEGVLATNHHVVDEAFRIEVVLADERTVHAAGVLASDAENDLALLKLPSVGVKPLPLETSSTLEPGDRVFVLGSPLGLSGTVSDGIVAALRPKGLGSAAGVGGFEKTPLVQVTAPISPGSSGSPVLNARGAVIGVAVGQLSYGQNLNFAIPADTLIALMARGQTGKLERELGEGAKIDTWSYVRNVGISAAVFLAVYIGFRRMKGS